jgi:hypothetical protein
MHLPARGLALQVMAHRKKSDDGAAGCLCVLPRGPRITVIKDGRACLTSFDVLFL